MNHTTLHNPPNIEAIAIELIGEPTSKRGTELRFNSRGSIAVDIAKNQFFDFESNHGGGWLALVMHFNQCSKAEALQWLRTHGFIEDREYQPTRQSKPRDPKPAQPAKTEKPQAETPRAELVDQIWNSAGLPQLAGTSYLQRRIAEYIPSFEPPCIRWLKASNAPKFTKGWSNLPPDASGAICYAYEDSTGKLQAVQIEGLTERGTFTDPRHRRTVGTIAGAGMVIRGYEPTKAIIAEGPIDALTIYETYPRELIICTGGTANMAATVPLILNHAGITLPIEIEADSGRPGRMAAHDLYLQLKQAGAQVSKPTLYRDDSDPADRFNRATI